MQKFLSDQVYGISGPQTFDHSSEQEKSLSDKMDKYLHDVGFFEDSCDSMKRERVLGRLNHLLNSFVRKKCIEKGFSEKEASELQAQILVKFQA